MQNFTNIGEKYVYTGFNNRIRTIRNVACKNSIWKGTEVIAVDQDKELVDEAAGFLDDALCLDATDETALGKLCPKERDVVICAIGAREPSILTTAILRQMGCDNVIARATDKIHERILKAVGAKNVINPDAEYGKNLLIKFFSKILLLMKRLKIYSFLK